MTYLNQAGTSWPKPEPVRAAARAALEADPRVWADRFEADHAAVAGFFGLRSPDRLLLTPGCTSALAVAVADHPWAAGDRILIGSHEHLALERPVLALRERGVEVVVLPPGGGQAVDLDRTRDELSRGGVRLVAFSAASNVTGDLAPTANLIALAREHGALSLVDGAQVAGWWRLDLEALGADLFAFAGHKGLHGIWGLGGLFVAEDVRLHTPRRDGPLPGPGYCDVGSVDRAGLSALAAAVRWLSDSDRAYRLEVARARTARLRAALDDLEGTTLHGHPDPSRRMPTLAVSVAGHTPSALGRRLTAAGVIASGGQQCAPLAHRTLGTLPDGVLRFSFGPGNCDEDVDHAAEALRAALVQRSESSDPVPGSCLPIAD